MHPVALTGRIHPQNFLKVIGDLSKAQKILREKRIIHGDIKAENVLLSDNNSKLIDFGNAEFYRNVVNSLSVPHDTKQLISTNIGDQITGTMGMFAPEILQGRLATHRTDAYSAGAMYIQSITGELPYLDYSRLKLLYGGVSDITLKDFEELYHKVITQTDYNRDILRAIVSLCHPEPKKRSIDELIELTEKALNGSIPLHQEVRICIPNPIYQSTDSVKEIERFDSSEVTQDDYPNLIQTAKIPFDISNIVLQESCEESVGFGPMESAPKRLASTKALRKKATNGHHITI